MIDLFLQPSTWATLIMLSALEIVLSIDNLVFIAIISSKLPVHQQKLARRLGLALAVGFRVGLLAMAAWLITLNNTLFTVVGMDISARDLVLILGGLFLIWKSTLEIHERVAIYPPEKKKKDVKANMFWAAIVQIIVIDVVFSLDSIITAVGLAQELPVMIMAVLIAVFVMIVASEPLAKIIDKHPTIVMLALAFLIMIGMTLIAGGFDYEVPKSFLYIAMAFSVGVEWLNTLQRKSEEKRRQNGNGNV